MENKLIESQNEQLIRGRLIDITQRGKRKEVLIQSSKMTQRCSGFVGTRKKKKFTNLLEQRGGDKGFRRF